MSEQTNNTFYSIQIDPYMTCLDCKKPSVTVIFPYEPEDSEFGLSLNLIAHVEVNLAQSFFDLPVGGNLTVSSVFLFQQKAVFKEQPIACVVEGGLLESVEQNEGLMERIAQAISEYAAISAA